jgi:hypothetical protein
MFVTSFDSLDSEESHYISTSMVWIKWMVLVFRLSLRLAGRVPEIVTTLYFGQTLSKMT